MTADDRAQLGELADARELVDQARELREWAAEMDARITKLEERNHRVERVIGDVDGMHEEI